MSIHGNIRRRSHRVAVVRAPLPPLLEWGGKAGLECQGLPDGTTDLHLERVAGTTLHPDVLEMVHW